jgi:hypothetical protein
MSTVRFDQVAFDQAMRRYLRRLQLFQEAKAKGRFNAGDLEPTPPRKEDYYIVDVPVEPAPAPAPAPGKEPKEFQSRFVTAITGHTPFPKAIFKDDVGKPYTLVSFTIPTSADYAFSTRLSIQTDADSDKWMWGASNALRLTIQRKKKVLASFMVNGLDLFPYDGSVYEQQLTGFLPGALVNETYDIVATFLGTVPPVVAPASNMNLYPLQIRPLK